VSLSLCCIQCVCLLNVPPLWLGVSSLTHHVVLNSRSGLQWGDLWVGKLIRWLKLGSLDVDSGLSELTKWNLFKLWVSINPFYNLSCFRVLDYTLKPVWVCINLWINFRIRWNICLLNKSSRLLNIWIWRNLILVHIRCL
jgi:hypothetical protein